MRGRATFIAVLVAAASACDGALEGVSCEDAIPCLVGTCIEGVCVEEQAFEPDSGASGTLVLLEPASGATVGAPMVATAALELPEGETLPETVRLMATHAPSGASEVLLLTRVEGSRYRGSTTLMHDGSYRLVARCLERRLASEPVDVTAAGCAAGCAAGQECLRGACVSPVRAIEITSPASGLQQESWDLEVRAVVVRTPGTLGPLPQALGLELSGPGVPAALSRLLPAGDAYAASLSVDGDGVYRLVAAAALPDGGSLKSPPVDVSVNRPPPLTLEVQYPEGRGVEPVFGSEYVRRDELAQLIVWSPDPDLDEGSIELTIVMPDADPSETRPLSGWGAVEDCDSLEKPRCSRVSVPMWGPTLKMSTQVRATMALSVSAQDTWGSPAVQTGELRLTRWKWEYRQPGEVQVLFPALSPQGRIVAATARAGAGSQLVSLEANGELVGETELPAGMQIGYLGLAVEPLARETRVIVAGSMPGQGLGRRGFVGTGALSAVPTIADCGPWEGLTEVSLSVLDGTETPRIVGFAGAVTANSPGRWFSLTLGDACSNGELASGSATSNTLVLGSMIAYGAGGWARSLEITTTGLAPHGSPDVLLSPDGTVRGLVMSSVGVAAWVRGATATGDFLFHRNLMTSRTVTSEVRARGIASSRESLWVASGSQVLQLDLALASQGEVALSEPAYDAPVLGAGGALYIPVSSAVSGAIQAHHPGGLETWTYELGARITGAPTLDCSRGEVDSVGLPGRPGVLYVGTADGRLVALVVDSPGIDASAPWPKWGHDPRNSFRAFGDLTSYSCP